MNASLSFSFNLLGWHAASTRLHSDEEWGAWAGGRLRAEDLPDTPPPVAFLPAMQRRRLGVSARLLFQAAHPLVAENECCPLVLASHDGEINRSFALWVGLLRENEVSPTSFGLSVHNALAGQWSMLRGDMSEYTALSVRGDGLEAALAEAAGFLADGADKVLVAVVDEPLQAQYSAAPAERAPFPYALSMLLGRGDGWRLSAIPAAAGQQAQNGYWGALSWLQHELSGCLEWQHLYADKVWQWQKKHP